MTWMCSGFQLCSQGPAQCRGPRSFGIRSPRLTVPEVLTHPSAKRGQPPLLKACSWTNLQRPSPSCSHANLEQTGSRKTTEKLASLSQVEPRTSNLCFPHPFASQGPKPTQCLAISSAHAFQLCPALQGQRGCWISVRPSQRLTGSCFLGQNSNPLLSGEKELSAGNRLRPLPSLPLALTSEHGSNPWKKAERRRQKRRGGREATSSTCLNIKLLQEAGDGLWRDKRDGQFHHFPRAEKQCPNTQTSPCPESII